MKYEDIKNILKRHDFVEICTIYSDDVNKYVIVSATKDMLLVLPILEEEHLAAACPTLAMPYSLISSIAKIDNIGLLFYSNLNNKYIDDAIIGNIPKRIRHAKVPIPM